MTKNFIIFRGGYDKGYKIFMADENLFVCILIYLYVSSFISIKKHTFSVNYKKCKNNKINFSLKYRFYYFMNWAIKIISKT